MISGQVSEEDRLSWYLQGTRTSVEQGLSTSLPILELADLMVKGQLGRWMVFKQSLGSSRVEI
jgi:hypothetical protein